MTNKSYGLIHLSSWHKSEFPTQGFLVFPIGWEIKPLTRAALHPSRPPPKMLPLIAFRSSLFRDTLFSLVVFYDGTFSRQFFILRYLSFCDIFSALWFCFPLLTPQSLSPQLRQWQFRHFETLRLLTTLFSRDFFLFHFFLFWFVLFRHRLRIKIITFWFQSLYQPWLLRHIHSSWSKCWPTSFVLR